MKARRSQLEKERETRAKADAVIRHMYSVFPGYKESVTRPVLRELLTHVDNKYIRNGHIYNVHSKHIGAGIYHAWMEVAS